MSPGCGCEKRQVAQIQFALRERVRRKGTLGQYRKQDALLPQLEALVAAADALCPSLTYRQRLQGTLACFVIGLTFSIVGTILWWTGHVASFALLYTLGNLTSICGTGFLIGPKKQVKNMCKARRAIATCIYFGAMVLTLAAAFSSLGTGSAVFHGSQTTLGNRIDNVIALMSSEHVGAI